MGGRVLGETGEVRIKGGFGSRVSSFTHSLSPANPCPPQPPCLVGAPSHVAPTQCFPHSIPCHPHGRPWRRGSRSLHFPAEEGERGDPSPNSFPKAHSPPSPRMGGVMDGEWGGIHVLSLLVFHLLPLPLCCLAHCGRGRRRLPSTPTWDSAPYPSPLPTSHGT